ncbi:MAG: helix-turn-helix domain-containing protein [Candidatus Thermoplasmatota archaeon]|nr:helix-turn-helix domain-containing protein [Candidatus Thermoplasmatota archaeon]MEE3315718.1 helix-turn-helix domain-containing protein [Candidatus Thermoplasmatota archaeon]
MRAVRVECSIPSIEHDQRVQAALQAVSWDYRGVLDQIDGRLRVMFECITTDGNCPPSGFKVGGVTVIEILEEWTTEYLTHHLVSLEFDQELVGRFFQSRDLTLLAGTNLTSSGLIIQVAGRQSSMVNFLRAIREAVPVDRITSAKSSEGLIQKGPTLQQHRIIKLAHRNGWYEVPKKISIRGLASKLGLSKSTVAEQLVKAESEIVGGFLENSR